MADKTTAESLRARISGVRAGRIYKLLKLLAEGPISRNQVLKKMKPGIRTFFRDVELLRNSGVEIVVRDFGYTLVDDLDSVLDLLPFPDPKLTFGDVKFLMKGRAASQLKLRKAFEEMTK